MGWHQAPRGRGGAGRRRLAFRARSSRGGEITWSTPTECEHYVERLQHAAATLAHDLYMQSYYNGFTNIDDVGLTQTTATC